MGQNPFRRFCRFPSRGPESTGLRIRNQGDGRMERPSVNRPKPRQSSPFTTAPRQSTRTRGMNHTMRKPSHDYARIPDHRMAFPNVCFGSARRRLRQGRTAFSWTAHPETRGLHLAPLCKKLSEHLPIAVGHPALELDPPPPPGSSSPHRSPHEVASKVMAIDPSSARRTGPTGRRGWKTNTQVSRSRTGSISVRLP